MSTRAAIVAEARGWLGTPFHHQARLKGVGVDCIGLVIGVARALALVPAAFDVGGYPRQPDGRTLVDTAARHMTRIDRTDMQPGDVVAVSFGGDPQHFGIVAPYTHGGLSIIHAAGGGGHDRVIETRLMFSRALQFVAAFRLPGVY